MLSVSRCYDFKRIIVTNWVFVRRMLVFIFLIPISSTWAMWHAMKNFLKSISTLNDRKKYSPKLPVICWRAHVCVFFSFSHGGVQHILCCVFLLFVFVMCLVYHMLPVSLDCPFFIALSVFSNVYFIYSRNQALEV